MFENMGEEGDGLGWVWGVVYNFVFIQLRFRFVERGRDCVCIVLEGGISVFQKVDFILFKKLDC